MSAEAISAFLAKTEWADAETHPLAGDASARRYLRLENGPGPALVMIAPPETCGPLAPFLDMTAHLKTHGFRVPAIYAEDVTRGLLLLEDFGDGILARLADADPTQETTLYLRATDVLCRLHHAPLPNVPRLGPEVLANMLDPLFDHYAPGRLDSAEIKETLQNLLIEQAPWRDALALRDFHAENLVALSDANEAGRIGLLDYQDAVITHPAYDLASLLQDARRPLSDEVESVCLDRFLAKSDLDRQQFLRGYHLIALQRNLRILGIFARLQKERPGGRYGAFQPIVWHHVRRMLATETCAPLQPLLADLPNPEGHA